MFSEYINHQVSVDTLAACRAIIQQCFDNYGGQNYENFYNPSSGLFASGEAPKWFALYEYDSNGNQVPGYASECAKQLAEIDACKDNIEQVFGGFDYYATKKDIFQRYKFINQPRVLRPSGIATEVYNQIIDILQTNCTNLDGKFMTIQNLALDEYKNSYSETNFCQETFNKSGSRYYGLYKAYSIGKTANEVIIKQQPTYQQASTTTQTTPQYSTIFKPLQPKQHISENMCPRDYETQIDVQSWGACLCWEKGGRRSNDGTSKRCSTSFPVRPLSHHEETKTTIRQIKDTIKLQKNKKFTAKYLTHVKENIDRYIASVLVVNTVANTVGASLATALAVTRLSQSAAMALPVVLTVLILLFGEITPKTLGVKQAKTFAPIVAVPFYYITIILGYTGLIWLCLTLTKRWTREDEKKKDVSVEDINSLVSLGLREDVIDRQQASVIKNILSLKSVSARKVMTPRQVVFSLDADKTIGETLDERGNWPFSRVPLHGAKKDDWVGIVLRRDAYNKLAEGKRDVKLRQLMRPLQLIPDSVSLDRLLLRFLKQRGHMVGVVDEFGSIAGIVSLEDVLEEILGREIVDEYDESVNLQETARRRSKALAYMRKNRK